MKRLITVALCIISSGIVLIMLLVSDKFVLTGSIIFPGQIGNSIRIQCSTLYSIDLQSKEKDATDIALNSNNKLRYQDPSVFGQSIICVSIESKFIDDESRILEIENGQTKVVKAKKDGSCYSRPVATSSAVYYLDHDKEDDTKTHGKLMKYDRVSKTSTFLLADCGSFQVSEDQKQILFTRFYEKITGDLYTETSKVFVYDLNNMAERVITEGKYPFWYSDHSFLYLDSKSTAMMKYDMEINTNKLLFPILGLSITNQPVLSPDKKYIAACTNFDSVFVSKLYIISLTGDKMEIKQYLKLYGWGNEGGIAWANWP